MALTTAQCQQFNSFLGQRPYNWVKHISKDRKPSDQIYFSLYKQETWPTFHGTTLYHERVYVNRPNDPSLWQQFIADPCIGNPCTRNRQFISHGVDQLRFDRYKREYQTDVFCLDQLTTVEEGIQKVAAIVEGYKDIPNMIVSDFLRLLTLRKAGTNAIGGGLWLAGVSDTAGTPQALDVVDTNSTAPGGVGNMFSVSQGESLVGSKNKLFINLNYTGGLTGLPTSITTTAGLKAALGMLSMEYLANHQEDLAANGYHNKEWLVDGKFSVTTDATTRRRLLVANPALTQMYSAADFAKGGAFYSFGVTSGCGDWLFKEDREQMRFRFRADMDGKDFNGNALTNAVWIEQVWPFENLPATFGKKPVYSQAWKKAPIALYHVFNREARNIYVGDITNVNEEMAFGMARDLLGKWMWKSPEVIISTDPNTGIQCTLQNDLKNQGYWVGEFDLGEQTIYPEIERLILALREPQPYVVVPTTYTPASAPASATDYQSILAYNTLCYQNVGWTFPPED